MIKTRRSSNRTNWVMDERYLVLILLISSLLFLGCTETHEYGGDTLILSRKDVSDINGDGVGDIATYVFLPKEYSAVSLQKVVVVKPYWDLSKINVSLDSDDGQESKVVRLYITNTSIFDQMEYHLDQFDAKRKGTANSGETQCKRLMVLDRPDLPCVDEHTCAQACMASPVCKHYYEGVGQPFVQQMLELNEGFDQMDSEVEHLRSLIHKLKVTSNNMSQSDVEEFMETLYRISYLGAEINNNPIINPNVYGGVCEQIDYDNRELTIIGNLLTTNMVIETSGPNVSMNRELPEYEYVDYYVVLLMKFPSQSISYEEMIVKDKLPDIQMYDLVIDSNFTELSNNSVVWHIRKIGSGDVESYMAYSFRSKKLMDEDEILSSMYYPTVEIKTVSPGSPALRPLTSLFTSVFSFVRPLTNYHVALVMGLFVILLIIRFLYLLITFIISLLTGLVKRDASRSIKEWIGQGSPNYKKYIIIGLVLALVGSVVSLILSRDGPSEFDLSQVVSILRQDIVQTVLSVLFLVGLLTFWFSLEDGVRRLLGGIPKRTTLIKRNLKDLDELNQRIGKINRLLSEARKLHLNISDEEKTLFSIPIDRIKRLINEINDQKTAHVLLEESLSRTEMLEKTLSDKLNKAKLYLKKVEVEIPKLLADNNSFNIDNLVEIPSEWRNWAVEQYILTHPEKELVLENNTVKHPTEREQKQRIINFVRDMVRSGVQKVSIHKLTGEVKSYKIEGVNQEYLFLLYTKLLKSFKDKEDHYLYFRTSNHSVFVLFKPSKNMIITLVGPKNKEIRWYLGLIDIVNKYF